MEQTTTAPRTRSTLTVVSGGVAYLFVGPPGIRAQIPVTTTTEPGSGTTQPTTPPPTGEPSDDGGGIISSQSVVLLVGLAIFIGALVTIYRKGTKPYKR